MESDDRIDISTESSALDGLTPDQQHRLSEILDRYLSALERGLPPHPETLLADHPDLAAPLRLYLSSLDALHDVAGVFGKSPQDAQPNLPALDEHEQRLGDFVLVREIGRGGMGIVYEARQTSLGRRVALKVLPFASILDSRQIARFRNEAQAAAQLHHPNIVPVHAVGVERGVHYYAMQFIDGQSLDRAIAQLRDKSRGGLSKAGSRTGTASSDNDTERIAAQPTRWSDGKSFLTRKCDEPYFQSVVRLGVQAAGALHYAHEYGIVHRDIKPSNLLLDSDGRVWVADFGLARCQSEATLTRTGDVVGTMRYMSPEQAIGKSALIDHRTDVYSLGATLYELLTLRPAFPGDDGPALLRQIDQDEPRRLRQIRPELPADLETVILKAMAKRRDERYATAQDLADDLQRVLDGKPTLAKPPTVGDRIYKWVRRHHRIAAVTAVAGLLALLGLAIGTLLINREKVRAQHNSERAKLNFDEARDAVYQFGTRMAERLADVPGAEQVRRELLLNTLDYYHRLLLQARDNETLQDDLGLTYNKIGRITAEIGSTEEAIKAHEDAAGIFEKLASNHPEVPEHRRNLALCRNHIGLLSSRTGEIETASRAFDDAIELQKRLVAESPEAAQYQADLALSLNNLGLLQSQTGRNDLAEASFREAIRRQLDLSSAMPDDASQYRNLAASYNNLGALRAATDPLQAVKWYEKAQACQEKAVAASPGMAEYERDLALTCNNLGAAQSRAQRTSDAVNSYGRAIEIQRRLVAAAPSHKLYRRDLAVSWNNLGLVHSGLSHADEAQQSFRQALAIQEPLAAQCPNDTSLQSSLGGIYNNLGIVLEGSGQQEAAAEAYKTALSHQLAAFNRAPNVADYRVFLSKHYYNYGRLLRQLGKPEEAARIALARKQLWPRDPERLFTVAEELAQASHLLTKSRGTGMTAEECATLAISTLQQAVDAGLKFSSGLSSKESLAGIREDARFLKLAGR